MGRFSDFLREGEDERLKRDGKRYAEKIALVREGMGPDATTDQAMQVLLLLQLKSIEDELGRARYVTVAPPAATSRHEDY